MLGPTKTKTKKPSVSKENKNAKKVISVKRGLRQPKMAKSKSGCKVSSAEIGSKHLKKRMNSTKKIQSRNIESKSVTEKPKNRTSKLVVLKKTQSKMKNDPHNKLNPRLRQVPQNKKTDKENSLKTFIKYSKDFKKNHSINPIFVSLDNTDEDKRYKNKFRKPTSARKLKRLRENLWKKSSYHKRFLGKSGVVKSQKPEKNKSKAVKSTRKRLSPKQGDPNLHKSEDKNSTDGTGKKNFEQNAIQSKPSNEYDLGIKKEDQINLEPLPAYSKKSSREDVSTIDESYMKSLLSIANCNSKPEKVELEQQRKDFCNKGTKTEKTKITGKEFFVNKVKNKKNLSELTTKNLDSKTSCLESDDTNIQRSPPKEKSNSGSVLRDAAKSETQIKALKKKVTDTKNKEIKNKQKKAYSKHEIKGLQQKKKTRNIVKNKKEDNIEIPFPCDALKSGEVQELWKRENTAKLRISRSSDSSSTIAENINYQNVKGLGMESYQVLKKFVAEEVYRISKNYNKNDLQKKEIENDTENPDKENFKERNLISNEKQFSSFVRKKLAVKSRESLLQGEKILRNAENFKTVDFLQGGKPQSVKSKLKLLEEQKSTIKKIPDEIIKNWSIVNRLEQAFLALGTPNFRKTKEKEPPTTNAKAERTTDKNSAEVKKVEKKIKDGEKKEKKPATRVNTINRQKVSEKNKPNEKQLRVLHKKESATSNRKPGTPTSIVSTKSSKINDAPKPKEEKSRIQSQSPLSKPSIKPTSKLTKSGIKPPTPVENLCSSWNKILGSQQIGKVGKKNSPRNHLCESSTQNKHIDNLERKKTFQVISLKDSVIMQPRRSKSCNKIDRNSEVDKKNSLSPTRSQECKSLTSLNEKGTDFCDHLKETEKKKPGEESKNKETETEQKYTLPALKSSNSKDFGQMSEISRNNSRENEKEAPKSKPKEEIKCEQKPPQEISEQAKVTKDKNHGSKTRAIKERSILSIRTNQHENQTSRTNISQIQEECTPLLFQADTSDLPKTEDRKEAVKVNVFLPPTKNNCSESSSTSLSTFDFETSDSSAKNSGQILTNDDELKLLKAPSVAFSKSTQVIASQTSTRNVIRKTIINAPWEQDINQYRALVKEIMSQYKRLDGFLKQSENMKPLPEDLEELKSSEEQVDILKEKVSIQEYRKKIILEYQEVPILEYKSKMEEIQKKLDGRWKRRNLLVVQPVNKEVDLDVKDYVPKMRTVLGSRLYSDKENFKRQETSVHLKEKKLSLQEVILCKRTKPKNCLHPISTPKSCLNYSNPRQSICSDENKPEEKFREAEFFCLVSTSNFNNL